MSVLFSLETDCIGLHEQGATDPDWKKSIEKYRMRYKYVADCSTYGYLPKAVVHDSVKVYVKKDAESSAKECTERFGYEVHLPSIQMLREYADKWAASNSPVTGAELSAPKGVVHPYSPVAKRPIAQVPKIPFNP